MARKDGKDRGLFERPAGVWWVRIFHDGRERRIKVGSKTAAKTFYQKVKTEQMEGRLFWEKHQRKRVAFSELAKERLRYADATFKRKGGDDHRMKWWTDAFGNSDAATITPSMIERVMGEMRNFGYAPASINRCLMVLKATFSRAVRDGLLEKNPAGKVKPYKQNNELVRYLTPKQEAVLVENLSEHYRPIVLVAINTGLRLGELLRLAWGDIDWNAGILTVRESKSGEPRRLPMNSIVQGIVSGRKPAGDYSRIFPHDGSQLRKAFNQAVKASGLTPFRLHDLRHTFASRLAMQGANDRTIMVLGGWKSPAMLRRYAHLSPTHLWQAVEGLVTPKPVKEGQYQNETGTKTGTREEEGKGGGS
ncbi:MAG: site-specific integrase [Nitrospirae bacterium]|nr:site-specific integrase [Nitrospirota bacterium]